MLVYLQSKRAQFAVNDGRKGVLDASVKDLRARRHNADLHFSVWQNAQQGLRARRFAHRFHNILCNDERNDAHPCELRARLDGEVLCDRRNHHVRDVVHSVERILIYLEHARDRRCQLNLTFLRLARRHVFTLAKISQNRRRIVLVQHIFVIFPDVNMLLTEPQQHLDILGANHIALAKPRALALSAHNLRDVVAEDHPHGILNTNLPHRFSPRSIGMYLRKHTVYNTHL